MTLCPLDTRRSYGGPGGAAYESMRVAHILRCVGPGYGMLATGHAPSIRGDDEKEHTWRKAKRIAACRSAQLLLHSHFRRPTGGLLLWNNFEANNPSFSSFTAAGGDHSANGRWASWLMRIKTFVMPALPC